MSVVTILHRGQSFLISALITALIHLQSPELHLCAGPKTTSNQLPELLELLCFTGCSSLFSTADRFDFFKNKRRVGGKQRKSTLS